MAGLCQKYSFIHQYRNSLIREMHISIGIKVIIDFLKVFFGPDVGSFVGGCLSNFSSPANLQSLIWRRVVTAVSCRFTLPRLTSEFLQCDSCERFIFKNMKDHLSTGVVLSQPG